MFFTQEDYRKIEKWLLANSRKDTDFVGAVTPLQGNETLAFVQKGKNVKVSLKDLIDQIFLLGVSDFLNISDKYKENYISLNQAIALVPNKSRKIGQVITFLNQEGVWKIYQFQGTKVNQWNNTTLWIDLIQQIQGLDIVDSEDIIPKISATNQTSLLLADKSYNPDDFSGLGRVYLRKNMQKVINPNTGMYYTTNLLTQEMVSKENTIYIIQYDYDLNGQTITIPEGCVLRFNGGTLSNGNINLNYCNIDNTTNSIIINNCILEGYLNKQTVYSDWFYLDSDDCTDTLSNIFKISKGCKLILNKRTYNVSVKNLIGTDYADPMNTSILQPQSNSHITINGTIQLISNDRTHYNIIGIIDKDNILLDGTGEIIGDVETHTGTTGEWGHGVLISGSRNINVKDLRISYCWGDGLSVSYAEKILTDKGLVNSPYSPPEIINITNIKSSYNRRLGISIINGDGIILENSITEGNGTINGTSPKAGLDIEPNPNQSVNNVIVNGCLFYDNVVTYFPSDGLIKDEAISCIIQNSICKKQVTIGNVGKVIGCEIKYLLINGSRFVNIQNNVITEALVLSGTTITGLNVIDNTFLGLTTDGYDSCIRVSCDSFSKVNIASNNFSLCTNSNMRKLVTYTKKQTNAIDIVDSVITYDKTLTLLFYPYANFYNCEFIFSGFNIYNITSELDKYPDSCSFIGCKFAANNSSFYIRDNITDNYKITIENCEYYTKQDNPTDFINYIGHTIALDLVVLNNKGKSVFLKNDIDEAHKRPIINNNYNGHRFYNITNKRPEYYYNNNWWDSCGYNVNENRNSDGTLIEKVRIVSDSSKIVNSNIRYVIVSDIDLQGETLTIPAGCTLDFQGGSIINGTVVFNKTNIIEPSSTIFKNIVLNGTIENQYINIGWFKDVADYSNLIENLLKIGNIYFPNGTYKFSTIVKIDTDDRIIAGNNIENTIITAIDSNPLNFLSVRANNISIKNLSFIDNPEGYPSKGTAQGARASYEIEVRENATNTIISNCSFKQATGGIFAYQGAVGLQIINCIFEDMVYIPRDINNLPLGGAGGYGVVCHFDGDNNHNIGVKDVLIKNNTFKDTIYRHAIYIQNVYNCIVEDNTSYHTNEEKASGYESHMMYYGGQGVNIVNNYFYGGCGALTTSADAEGNNASFFTFSNNHIIDWQCYKSGNGGIALGNMSNCIISNNVFNSAYKCAAIKISENCDFVKIINNSINTGNEAPTGIAQLAPISSDSGFPTLKNIDIINNTITTQHVYCCYFRFINSSNVLTDGIRNIKITNNTLSSTNTGIRIQNSNIFSNILISGNTFLMPTPLSLFEVNSPSTGKEGIILTNNYWENGDFVSKLGDYLYILVINNIIGKGGNNDDYVGRMLLPSGNHLIPAKGNYLGPEIVPGVKCDYGDVIINRTTERQAPVMWMCISGGIAGTDNVRFIPIYGKLYGTTNERESIDFSTLSSQEKSDLSLGMIYFDSDLRKPVVYNGSYWTYFDGWNVEYLRSGTTAQRPILNANQVPFQYYDTDLKKFINWNGTAWVNLDGTALI